MLELFKRILEKWACRHRWKLFSRTDVSNEWGESWTRERYVCTECGKFKTFHKI